ncbi:MAG: transposase [Gammaproteobacteria bacterium]|nr:transposase [Gammaproteobacteria bacterium]
MPRRPRIVLPDTPLHIIQRGNNRQPCFYTKNDYLFYLDWLKEYAELSVCSIHAYVLMTNHVHLLLTPHKKDSVSILMKRLGQHYVQYINRSHHRSGTLWEGRFRSCITQEENYILNCYRYIESNPVRAYMVKHPEEYQWSSYRINALNDNSDLITPHDIYKGLGHDDNHRKQNYRKLFQHPIDTEILDNIRSATNGNFALGTDHFKAQIESILGRRVMPGESGRPRKNS